jgi:suppressor of fused
MTLNGPIAAGETTQITFIGMVEDPEMAWTATPNGRVDFLQVVRLTEAEAEAGQRWRTREVLNLLLPCMPNWITDLGVTR